MRRTLAAAVVAALLPLWHVAASTSPAYALSADLMLARLTNPVAAAASLPTGVRVVQWSSHDRQGGNIDGGWYDDGPPLSLLDQPPTWVRHDAGGTVLLDEQRPG